MLGDHTGVQKEAAALRWGLVKEVLGLTGLALLIILAVTGFIRDLSGPALPHDPALAACGMRDSAVEVVGGRAAKEAIRQQLRAPSAASFAPDDELGYRLVDGCTVELKGWVDAQNGFGATTRSSWVARLDQDSPDHFRVLSAVVLE